MFGPTASNRLLLLILFEILFGNGNTAVQNQKLQPTDFLLCRHCGFNIASSATVTNVKSPSALSLTNQTLFGLDSVLVQTLRNPIGISFQVVTARGGTCVGSAQTWQTEHTWFPGHAWKICTCSRCSGLIGWIFEPLQTATPVRAFASTKGFYAFIIENVISEAYADSLLIAPKITSYS